MSNNVNAAINKINELTQAEFVRISLINAKPTWQYVGSNGKDDGKDAQWIIFLDGSFTSITSSTYGDGDEYFLVQETVMDLHTLRGVAESVIPFGDCVADLDPSLDSDLSEIINNIAHCLPAHGGHTEVIINPKLSEEAKKLKTSSIEELINKLFSRAVSVYNLPF